MIRRRQVLPDANGVVTLEALIEIAVAGMQTLDFAGGVFSVVVDRAPTKLPGEMVTVGAVAEWRHDARVQPRPEQFEQPTSRPQPEPEPEVTEIPDPELDRLGLADDDNAGPAPDPADGFDFSKLEEEDVEGEPVGR